MVQPYLTPEQINSLYPVIGARLYRGGLVLLRLNLSPFDGTRRRGERGKIRFLSKQSRAKLLLLATTNARKFRSLITLTYGIDYPLEGARVKRDLNKMLTRLRQVYPDFEYLWFLEFQRRGAPHIHVLASLDEPDDTARLWFAGLWANIACGGVDAPYVALDVSGGRLVGGQELSTVYAVRWWHNRPRAWEGIKVRDGAARYAAKYALKPYQKSVPLEYQNVGRFWGASRGIRLDDGEMVYGSELEIREFLELKGRNFDKFDVLPKICVW